MNPAASQNFRDVAVDHPVRIVGADGRGFEANLNPDRVDYITDQGVEVWMERPAKCRGGGGNKTRFVDAAGEQIGPIHINLVPAVVWAIANGWRDPSAPDWWNDELAEEVSRGGAPDNRHADSVPPIKVGPWEEAR